MTREELILKFPKASESFLRDNADRVVSHSAISLSARPRGVVLAQQSTPRAEVAPPRTLTAPKPANGPIHLILPYPPSANNYWRSIMAKKRVLVIVSTEAKHYKRAIAIIAGAKVKTPLLGWLKLEMRIYRPRRIGDLSNTIKVLEDALQGICYENDSQIVEIHTKRFDDKANPRAEVFISEAVQPEDDLSLRLWSGELWEGPGPCNPRLSEPEPSLPP